MALPTFHFQASLPADRSGLQVLATLITEILRYVELPGAEAKAIAKEIEKIATDGLTSAKKGHITITFHKDGSRLEISLDAPYLPTPYHTERRVPDAS
jgi:hypothetical protein